MHAAGGRYGRIFLTFSATNWAGFIVSVTYKYILSVDESRLSFVASVFIGVCLNDVAFIRRLFFFTNCSAFIYEKLAYIFILIRKLKIDIAFIIFKKTRFIV